MLVSVTILVENTTPMRNLIGEYGFACLIRIDDTAILFDTGSSEALFHNSEALGIKLEEVPEVVISHGHFDHTGALLPLLKRFGPKRVYSHSQFLTPRLLPLDKGGFRKIGTPATRDQLEEAGAELVPADHFIEIRPGVYLTGEIPRSNNFEDTGGDFHKEIDGQIVADHLDDDSAMIIDHPQGLIIVSGCAHAGIINTITYARQRTGRDHVLAYIGGTHLMTASDDRLQQTVQALRSMPIDRLIIAHCTGFYAGATLYSQLGKMVVKGETGMVFRF